MDTSTQAKLWRARELLGSVGLLPWLGFHVWEQWAAFGGRERFVARLTGTSHGALPIVIELALGIAPIVAWIVVEARLRIARVEEPPELAGAMAEDPEIARRLGLIVRVGSWVLYGWLVYHVLWLWLPKLTEGSDPLRTWLRLRSGLDGWPRASLLALGLGGLFVHLCGAFVRLSVALDLARTVETRRAARLSGLIVAVGLLVLFAQLAGWHAAGAGTVWPL